MPTDRYGTSHSTQSPDAVAAFEAAVHGIAAHLPSRARPWREPLRLIRT